MSVLDQNGRIQALGFLARWPSITKFLTLRDIKAVMGKSTMRYYGEKSALGEKLPNMGVSEDTQQLGGNATIDSLTKKFIFIYPSKTAPDRPSLQQIISKH